MLLKFHRALLTGAALICAAPALAQDDLTDEDYQRMMQIEQPSGEFSDAYNRGDHAGARDAIAVQLDACFTKFGGGEATPRELMPCFVLTNLMSQTLSNLGEYEDAHLLANLSILSTEAVFGADSYVASSSYFTKGIAHEFQGEYQAALALYNRALPIVEAEDGADDPTNVGYYSRIAFVQGALGDYAGARSMIERAMALAEDPVDVANFRHIHAQMLIGLGQMAEAERTAQLGYDTLRAIHGDANAFTLELREVLAVAQMRQSKFEDAAVNLKAALATREGMDLPPIDKSEAMGFLAQALLSQGRPMEAEPYAREALRIQVDALGPSTPTTAMSHNLLGLVLLQQDKLTDSFVEFLAAVQIAQGNPDVSGDTLAVLLSNFATTVTTAGLFEEGLLYLAQASALGTERLGPTHPMSLLMRANFGVRLTVIPQFPGGEDAIQKLREKGLPTDGRAILRETYEQSLAGGADNARVTAITASSLGYLERQDGNLEAAADWYGEAERAGRIAFRSGQSDRISQLAGYGDIVLELGTDLPLARSLLREAGGQVRERIDRFTDFNAAAQEELDDYRDIFVGEVETAWRLSSEG